MLEEPNPIRHALDTQPAAGIAHTVRVEPLDLGSELSHAARFGLDGKSAYQAAVEGGYAGSEAEFNRQLAAAARTYLVDLSQADYPSIALQAATDLGQGLPVALYLRDGGALRTMTRVRDAGEAFVFSTAALEGAVVDGIAQLVEVQYALSKATGRITTMRSNLLASLLTTASVQDSLDGEAAMLPVSQRQAAALKRAIERLDGEAIHRGDTLILNGNGAKLNRYGR